MVQNIYPSFSDTYLDMAYFLRATHINYLVYSSRVFFKQIQYIYNFYIDEQNITLFVHVLLTNEHTVLHMVMNHYIKRTITPRAQANQWE